MKRHDMEQFARRWADAVEQGGGFEDLVAPRLGTTAFDERAGAMRARLGAFEVVIDELVCERDRIAWRWTLRAATTSVRGVSFQRVVDGRVVEHWTCAEAEASHVR